MEFACSVCGHSSTKKQNIIKHFNKKQSCGSGIKKIVEISIEIKCEYCNLVIYIYITCIIYITFITISSLSPIATFYESSALFDPLAAGCDSTSRIQCLSRRTDTKSTLQCSSWRVLQRIPKVIRPDYENCKATYGERYAEGTRRTERH